jgi:hypothetical protein
VTSNLEYANCGSNRDVHLSLAAFPMIGHREAMALASSMSVSATLVEPLWGELSINHVQLVPQSKGVLTEEIADDLRRSYPGTAFRLHANVRVNDSRVEYDLSNFRQEMEDFRTAKRIHDVLGATAYSAHAGYRRNASLQDVFDNARAAADLFGCAVAVEGLYPDRGNRQLLASWKEYRAMLESRVPYALDLSHLNIVATRSGRTERMLVRELLSSENCLEVHVSANNGLGDSHQVCSEVSWWLSELPSAHFQAVIFSEGNLRAFHKGVT